MSAATLSRWARRFLLVGAGLFVLGAASALGEFPRRVTVVLTLQGFVCTVAFGKAYSLLPTYFDRSLAWPRAPALHLPLTAGGVVALAVAATDPGEFDVLCRVGAVLWAAGVTVFLTTMLVTIRDNLTGAETATSEAKADRAHLDRVANAFMPVAMAYLAAGSYELLTAALDLPTLLDGFYPEVAHLLGAGFASLLIFSVGFRLLPRFFVAAPPPYVPEAVLLTGAVGPALVAAGLYTGPLFTAGAALQGVAMLGFATSFLVLFVRNDRRRVGFWGPLSGAGAGVLGVGLGVQFATAGLDATLGTAHYRLNLFGFLGLTIVGLLYQFYPPAVATWPLTGDRFALATIAALAGGVLLSAFGPLASPALGTAGLAVVTLAAAGVTYLLLATMRVRAGPG